MTHTNDTWGWVLALVALAASAMLTQLVRVLALGRGVVDVPNTRSSHRAPTPRGGGLAIVVVVTAGVALLAASGWVGVDLLWAILGGLAVAAVGFADDHRSLSPIFRVSVHFAAALWAIAWLGGLPPLRFGSHVAASGWLGYVLGTLGIVWAVNLFNFMDGLDGIAASEAMFICLAAMLLGQLMGVGIGVALSALLLAAAAGGFLLWNWPPARIFLGDVGSGYIGYVIVVLAVAAARDNPAALWVWLILGGAFFADATTTLVRRVRRGKRVHEAHRSHAYQRLARRLHSHRRVTLAMLLLNLLWLLPCALLAATLPAFAAALVLVGLVPLAVLAVLVGAGEDEPHSEEP
jgi:Fuc2NAc and GlcNAc transferase